MDRLRNFVSIVNVADYCIDQTIKRPESLEIRQINFIKIYNFGM